MDNGTDDSAADSETTYEIWAILIMNALMLIERIFKTSKFAMRCTKTGCFCGNRTPPTSTPTSPENSTEIVRTRDVMTMLKTVAESIDSLNKSMEAISSRYENSSGSSELTEDENWRNAKELRRNRRERERRGRLRSRSNSE